MIDDLAALGVDEDTAHGSRPMPGVLEDCARARVVRHSGDNPA